MEYYIGQDNLKDVKEWFEDLQKDRSEEAGRLEDELEEAIKDIESFNEELKGFYWKNKGHLELSNGEVDRRNMDIERYHRMLKDKRDFIKRRLNELVRQERDDIEWIWKLERNQREATKQYRSTDPTKQQLRAVNWKSKNQKDHPEPKEQG